MNRKKIIRFLSVGLILLAVSACSSKEIPEPVVAEPEAERPAKATEGSLWPGETSKSTLFSDKKASRVGDILQVHIIEKTSATNKATTRSSRDINAIVNNQLSADRSNVTHLGFGGGRNFKGNGQTSRSEKFQATVSAMVVEVLPNGQLKIEGQRQMKINDAMQYVQVAGTVRPEDINYDNSIISSKMANARIVYDGNGSLDKVQRTGGIFGKGLEMLWPF